MTAAYTNGTCKGSRFDLVTAGHHFLLDALPLRRPESLVALSTFVSAAENCHVPPADIDAVLLRCLAILNRHTGQTLPTLVDRYLSGDSNIANCLARFSRCVEDILRFRGIGDGRVQRAIGFIRKEYARPDLRPRFVAEALNVRLPTLCAAFRLQTGMTLSEYIRDVRLQEAGVLLATTDKSVKEVWTAVGYNHPSNFDHDFKRRFDVTPREHRARAIRPTVHEGSAAASVPAGDARRSKSSEREQKVLIVDDDEGTRTMIATYLNQEGYSVFSAATGGAGIRECDRVSPQVILLDYRLGDMTGIECLRAIRQRSGGDRAGVALFTADWDVFELEDDVRALEAVVTSKLCDLEQVRTVVDYLS